MLAWLIVEVFVGWSLNTGLVKDDLRDELKIAEKYTQIAKRIQAERRTFDFSKFLERDV